MDADQAIAAWTERFRAAVDKDSRSIDAIARKAGVSTSTATRLYNGTPDGPRLRTLLRLAAELRIAPSTWVKGLGGRG